MEGEGKRRTARAHEQQINASLIVLIIEASNGKSVRVETTPTDCVIDVRQFLLDCPETCDVTSYHLEHDGVTLNDYVEIGSFPQFVSTAGPHVLKIVPDFYDERAAKLHVRRLRELLVNPPAQVNPTLIPAIEKKNKTNTTPKPIVTITEVPAFTLSAYLEDENSKEEIPECVSNITFSAWNPPPGNRRLQGDLAYLEITTLESNTLHITASVDGFYLNQSTSSQFNPRKHPSPYKSQTLLGLLKKASVQFSKRITSLLNRKVNSHPFESIEVPHTVNNWLSSKAEHTYDWNRAEDALLATYGMDTRGVLRDWNEEYQSCRELPSASLPERVLRDRTLYRVYSDFVEAASKGACAVVQGNIVPINPMDNKRSYVYIYNNIFFSHAIDGRNQYQDVGGDAVSHVNAGHDLRGVMQYNQVDMPDLHTLATTLIDYRGHRIIAQSIIPGIFHGDKASTHVYGSMDQGATIECKEVFHALMEKMAEKLHTKERVVVDAQGEEKTLAVCMETKGITGSDGRNYVMDVIRATPRDANFPNYSENPTHLLRPELVTLFCRKIAYEKMAKENERLTKEQEKGKKASEKKGKDDYVLVSKDDATNNADKKTATATDSTTNNAVNTDKLYIEYLNEIRFNTDALTQVNVSAGKSAKGDEELLKEAAAFLVNTQIPKLVHSFRTLAKYPSDGASLTSLMHSEGINVRYLGRVAKLCEESKLQQTKSLCIREMITRCAKHYLAEQLRLVKPDKYTKSDHWFLAPCVATFLSSLLGEHCVGNGLTDDELACASKVLDRIAEAKAKSRAVADVTADAAAPVSSSKKKKKKKKGADSGAVRLADGSRAPVDPLAPANVWQALRRMAQAKFDYELPSSLPMLSAHEKVSLLRSVCKKTGIQVHCREYEWEQTTGADGDDAVFTVDDILDIFPVVKANLPKSKQCIELLDGGKAYLKQGRLKVSYQVLHEALNFHNQVFGPMHVDTASCYTTLARVCYHAGDHMQAMDHQQRALVIYERVQGKDHADTAHAHSQLALYFHMTKHSEAALSHLQRALYLFQLTCGEEHVDTCATHMNLAMIYQDIGQIASGIPHLQQALRGNTATLGAEHYHVGVSHHHLAIALSMAGNFRVAVKHMKQAKDIFAKVFGQDHIRVKQSAFWLNSFAAAAAKIAKGGVMMNDKLQKASPLTWINLRSGTDTPFRGRLTMNDVLKLFENAVARSPSQNPQQQQQQQQLLQQQHAATVDSTPTVDGTDEGTDAPTSTSQQTKNQRRKERRKRQKAQKKAEAQAQAAVSTPQ